MLHAPGLSLTWAFE